MFDMDIFGTSKVSAKEAIQEIMCGATRGLLEGYEGRLLEKTYEIDRLKQQIDEENDWKQKYEELAALVDLKRKEEEKRK